MSDYQIAESSQDIKPNQISPEGAVVANSYLENACSLKQTSLYLNMSQEDISTILNQPLIKTYVNSILREAGYRNMSKIAEKLDDLIDMKWEELKEAEIGSNKDIADLLSLAHKMQLDISKLLQEDTKQRGPMSQTNTQVNVYGEGNYGTLMQKLVEG